MNWLIERFPKAFDLRNRRPLKDDILADILKHLDESSPNETAISAALDYYMQWGSYLSNLDVGARCIDLDGIAVSFVTQKTADKAAQALQKAQAKQV